MNAAMKDPNNRFARRRLVLKGKKEDGAFDPDQYYLEASPRGQVARRLRSLLRRMQPVVLATPRWSLTQRFLDDVAVDLAIGQPKIAARPFSLAPLQKRSVAEAWTWLCKAFVEFCGLYLSGPVWQAVDRHGFRHVLSDLMNRTLEGPPRCLLIHGLEHLHVEARDDLVQVFEAHAETTGAARKLNLVFAGSVDAHFEVSGARRLTLHDYADSEAMDALVEYVGPYDEESLKAAVDAVGGVPALLQCLGEDPWRVAQLAGDPTSALRVLGPMADEIRGAMQIISSDSELGDRLEQIANDGPLPREEGDQQLLRAGFVISASDQVRMRAPVFTQLALES